MIQSPEKAIRATSRARRFGATATLLAAAVLALWTTLERGPNPSPPEARFWAVTTIALGIAMGSIAHPFRRWAFVPWLLAIGVLTLVPTFPDQSVVLGALLSIALLLRVWESADRDVEPAGPWTWIGLAIGAHLLTAGSDWITAPHAFARATWVTLPILSGLGLYLYSRNGNRSNSVLIAATLFCLAGGWSLLTASVAALLALLSVAEKGRTVAYVPAALVVIAFLFYNDLRTGAAAGAAYLLLWALARNVRPSIAILIGGAAALLLAADLATGASAGHLWLVFRRNLTTLLLCLAPLVMVQLMGWRSQRPNGNGLASRGYLAAAGLLLVGAALGMSREGPLIVTAVLVVHLLTRAKERDGERTEERSPWPLNWLACLFALTLILGTYPWLRELPLAELAAEHGAILGLGLLLTGGVTLIARPDRNADGWRRLGWTACIVAVALFARETKPSETLLSEPKQLTAENPRLILELPSRPRVHEIVLDGYLSNTLQLEPRTTVGTVVLMKSGQRVLEVPLTHRHNIGEWAGSRPDVVAEVGPPAPAAWRQALSTDGSHFVRQYRARWGTDETGRAGAVEADAVLIELQTALPGQPVLTLLSSSIRRSERMDPLDRETTEAKRGKP